VSRFYIPPAHSSVLASLLAGDWFGRLVAGWGRSSSLLARRLLSGLVLRRGSRRLLAVANRRRDALLGGSFLLAMRRCFCRIWRRESWEGKSFSGGGAYRLSLLYLATKWLAQEGRRLKNRWERKKECTKKRGCGSINEWKGGSSWGELR